MQIDAAAHLLDRAANKKSRKKEADLFNWNYFFNNILID
jgi:hypothetical protein